MAKRKFIPHIDLANAEIERLEAELDRVRAAAPAARPSAPAPRQTPRRELRGLARAMAANAKAQEEKR